MQIERFDHGLDLAKPTASYVRSPGVHASDLYNALFQEIDAARYDKRDPATGDPLPPDATKMELGISFEEVLERVLAERLFGLAERLGEFRSPENVIYTPDHLFYDQPELELGEFKCTWYSAKYAPLDKRFDKWWCQMKLYAYWLKIRRARLYALFVNGDYKPPTPQLLAWRVQFTERELEANYQMVMRFARRKGLLP